MSVVLPYPLPATCHTSEPLVVLCGDMYQRERRCVNLYAGSDGQWVRS
jgi:hypothetical protein